MIPTTAGAVSHHEKLTIYSDGLFVQEFSIYVAWLALDYSYMASEFELRMNLCQRSFDMNALEQNRKFKFPYGTKSFRDTI